MSTYKLNTTFKQQLADTLTPVSVYLKLRDIYPNSISYICCQPIASIQLHHNTITQSFPDGSRIQNTIEPKEDLSPYLEHFKSQFEVEEQEFKFIHNGLFGFTAYDAVSHFEEVSISRKANDLDVPDLYYAIYQNIIAINHFNNEAYIFEHLSPYKESNQAKILQLLQNQIVPAYPFQSQGELSSNLTDAEFRDMVIQAKKHCQRGDVFQLVLSRRFSQQFEGDEFEVYRSLRHINPSPYLFYFDYGSFKIFGSSPEAQLVIDDNRAEIHPIAGTFKRTGNDEKDRQLAQELSEDPKENAEHVMLVDLARNDLSRHGNLVNVDTYKDIQFFSHVIHLVSKVTSTIHKNTSTFDIVADTFPAGTLSGAPKPKALELIEKYEPVNRSLYGGAIGFMDFRGNYNHAIIIRTFVSKNHRLHLQAGAGIVSTSNEDNEVQEVYNKLGALTKAISLANSIQSN